MPEVFRERGFRFFYANEGTPREPVHIHVEKMTWKQSSGFVQKST